VVNVSQQDLLSHIRGETDGFGVDVAFECAGAAPSVRSCLIAARPLGHYTQVGHFGKEISAPLDYLAFKQIRMAGSVAYTVQTWIRMLKILEQGKVRLGDLITHKLPLDEWKAGFCSLRRQVSVESSFSSVI
jgi:L-iditol 2-dehydrogenase